MERAERAFRWALSGEVLCTLPRRAGLEESRRAVARLLDCSTHAVHLIAGPDEGGEALAVVVAPHYRVSCRACGARLFCCCDDEPCCCAESPVARELGCDACDREDDEAANAPSEEEVAFFVRWPGRAYCLGCGRSRCSCD